MKILQKSLHAQGFESSFDLWHGLMLKGFLF